MSLKVFAGLVVVGHCLLRLVDHGFFFWLSRRRLWKEEQADKEGAVQVMQAM